MTDAPERANESDQRVTSLELFFDLVFVFAITQVTGFLADHETWLGLLQGLLILGALWWTWAAYAWLTNTLNPEEGIVRIAVFASMAAMLIVALATPRAFSTDGVVFGVAYLFVRGLRPGWVQPDGTPAGLYFHRPADEALDRLSALLEGHAR